MKKLVFFLTCLFIVGTAFSQQNHLKFKGVPIDGTLQSYTNAMKQAGFNYKGSQDGVSILSGDFAGYKGCIIGVSTLKNCDVVCRISVLFPERETWASLLNDYKTLKAMLTEKYGKPSDSKERFTGYVGVPENGIIMHALKDGKYVWYTTFTTELGDIKLSIIAGTKYLTGCVCLSYLDKANSEKVRSAAMDDL